MNGAYGIQTRGDPPMRFGARGDPPVVNGSRDNSFEWELISSGITDRNDQDGRGMPEGEMERKGEWEIVIRREREKTMENVKRRVLSRDRRNPGNIIGTRFVRLNLTI